MGIPHVMVVQMRTEGIAMVNDLSEFSKEDINNLMTTLRKTPQPGVVPPTNFVFGARSQKRLIVAADIVR